VTSPEQLARPDVLARLAATAGMVGTPLEPISPHGLRAGRFRNQCDHASDQASEGGSGHGAASRAVAFTQNEPPSW